MAAPQIMGAPTGSGPSDDVLSTVLNGSWHWHTKQLHIQREQEREGTQREQERPASKQVRQVQQSLRLRNDPRYKEIEHYADVQAKGKGHFSQVQKRASLQDGTADPLHSLVPQSIDENHAVGPTMAGRLSWQKAFDTNVKRLLIDFNLTADPACRVHHLDGFHNWFKIHGGKQARKEKQAPSFLQVEKNAPPPPGSARGAMTGPVSNTTLILAGSLQMGPKFRNSP